MTGSSTIGAVQVGHLAGRVAVFICCGLLLSGCLSGRALRGDLSGSRELSAKRLPPAVEAAIGARNNPKVIAAYGGRYRDREVEAELAGIVSQLVAASGDPSRSYKITVLNSPVANAFALPGGYLYLTRGLLALANDSSEIATVLSHEIAHVMANHALARAELAQRTAVVDPVSKKPRRERRFFGKRRRDKAPTDLAQFSQTQELEADRIGIAIAARAGYDPHAAARFLERMERYADFRSATGAPGEAENFLSSHPSGLARRKLAEKAAHSQSRHRRKTRARDRYLDSIDGIVFGDDSSEGFVRGRDFLHPRLGIAFTASSGFKLENTNDAVLAAAGRDRAMRFDGVAAAVSTTPEDYLRSGWVNGLDTSSIELRQLNGFSAATARAKAGRWMFAIAVIKSQRRFYRFIFADSQDGERAHRAMLETINSFRPLSPEAIARLRPLRIDIVTVERGDTPNGLAARMKGTDEPLALFRILNGMERGDPVIAGQRVKLVVD